MNKKHFYGIGYRKVAKHSDNPRAYSVWQGILKRCYDPSHVRYSVYGGAGVRMCKRWHCFDNFLEDLSVISGWDRKRFEAGELQLDKDYKSKSKLYSKSKCCWLSKSDNNRLQPNQMRKFLAIDPDGNKYTALNKAEFSRNHGLLPSSVSKVLTGRGKSLKGWTFRYLT